MTAETDSSPEPAFGCLRPVSPAAPRPPNPPPTLATHPADAAVSSHPPPPVAPARPRSRTRRGPGPPASPSAPGWPPAHAPPSSPVTITFEARPDQAGPLADSLATLCEARRKRCLIKSIRLPCNSLRGGTQGFSDRIPFRRRRDESPIGFDLVFSGTR